MENFMFCAVWSMNRIIISCENWFNTSMTIHTA